MLRQEIEEIKNELVNDLNPLKIYLFGSFVNDTYTEESDFDFYIVVDDSIRDMVAETAKAYKAVRRIKKRPVDIVVGTESRFEKRKEIPSIENEVYRTGILRYESGI